MCVKRASIITWIFLAVVVVQAQEQPPAAKREPAKQDQPSAAKPEPAKAAAPSFRLDKLPAEQPTYEELNDFRQLVQGAERTPKTPRKQLLEKMARWLVNRLTWIEIQEGRDPSLTIYSIMDGEGERAALVTPGNADWNGALRAIPVPDRDSANADPKKIERQDKYLQEFREAMVPHLRKVMTSNLIARVNAARLMHRLAEARQEEIADELIAIIESPHEVEAVKYWAFKGLRALFTETKGQPKDAKDPKSLQRFERCGLLLCKELEARCKVPESTLSQLPPDEVEAMRFVRRQVVGALAATRKPLIAETKAQKLGGRPARRDGPAAVLLAKVMNDEVSPKPSWHERVEAAYGLCLMKPAADSSYQADFALHQVARFVGDLSASKPENERLKYFAEYLRSGLSSAGDNVAGPAKTFHSQLMAKAQLALNNLAEERRNPEGPDQLRQWVANAPLKGKDFFDPPLEQPAGGTKEKSSP